MNEDLSTAQRLQMAAMFTDALSNLIDRSKHLCNGPDNQTREHHTLLKQTVELTAATCAETIQSLIGQQVTVGQDAKGIGELP